MKRILAVITGVAFYIYAPAQIFAAEPANHPTSTTPVKAMAEFNPALPNYLNRKAQIYVTPSVQHKPTLAVEEPPIVSTAVDAAAVELVDVDAIPEDDNFDIMSLKPTDDKSQDEALEGTFSNKKKILEYAVHLAKASDSIHSETLTDINSLLDDGLSEEDIENAYSVLMPPHEQYHKLMTALYEYEAIADQGGWPTIGYGRLIRPNRKDHRIPTLRQRLAISGDLSNQHVTNSNVYDEPLQQAVAKFKRRHSLKDDLIVRRATITILNISVEYRIQQIKANLERWHEAPENFGYKHLMVNIPDFSLKVQKGTRTLLRQSVIVGRKSRKTPIFSDEMETLVINPYWKVPHRIAINDILPVAKETPQDLIDKQIRVYQGWGHERVELNPLEVDWENTPKRHFPYRFRQDPGPKNAMGKIKFLFPNENRVYIHGTPSMSLFDKDSRTFSSGCVRVEDPVSLASVILEDETGYSYDTLNEIIDQGQRSKIELNDPWQIHLMYWTAWVDDETGELNFRKDIYRKDKPKRHIPQMSSNMAQ